MRQEDRVSESRSKIIEAAIEEFGKKNYKEASTNDICERCGMSKGLVFYHFKSKEKLFVECATYCINEFDEYMKQNFIKTGTPIEDVRKCCMLRKDFFTSHPNYHHIFCQVLYERNEKNKNRNSILQEKYNKHSTEIIRKVLEEIDMNPRINREEGIKWAVVMIEVIDREIFGENYTRDETEQMLEKQMKQYANFLEMLFYGILNQK